jgi:hypothetical protein
MSRSTLANREHELEAQLRLGAAGVLIDAVTMGYWEPDDAVLEAIAELVDQAARLFDLAGWKSVAA